MISRLQLLNIANANSNKKIKDMLHSEKISKKLEYGIFEKKFRIKETIFLKNNCKIESCSIFAIFRNQQTVVFFCGVKTKIIARDVKIIIGRQKRNNKPLKTLEEIDKDFDKEIENIKSEDFISGVGVGFILLIVLFSILFGVVYGFKPL